MGFEGLVIEIGGGAGVGRGMAAEGVDEEVLVVGGVDAELAHRGQDLDIQGFHRDDQLAAGAKGEG
jgi:hypothetical protein